MSTKSNHILKKLTLEYIRTGCDGYQTLMNYLSGDRKSSLGLRNTPITHLPEGLHVGGNLDLYNTQITQLPDGLHVDGYLDLQNTPISKEYPIEQLREMLPNVKGRIYA